MCPTFHTILIVSHPEEAFYIGSTHVPIAHGEAISDKLKLVLIAILFSNQIRLVAFKFDSFEYSICVSPQWTEMVFSDFRYFNTVESGVLFALVYNYFGIFFGNQRLSLVSIQNH